MEAIMQYLSRRRRRRRRAWAVATGAAGWSLLLLALSFPVESFAPLLLQRRGFVPTTSYNCNKRIAVALVGAASSTRLNSFLGSDGGILGVGTPEVVTVLLVGYFVLGPSDLYKLVKEIGKFITNIRNLSGDLTKSFESNMESQLQLEELRKAQRELTDAFSFRRSINVDDTEAFATTVTSPREGGMPEETAEPGTARGVAGVTTGSETTSAPKKRKRVKRRKRQVEEADDDESTVATSGEVPDLENSMDEQDVVDREMSQYEDFDNNDYEATESSRFQQQMSGNWNDSILQNEDQLSPLAKVMELLAVLEQERVIATRRLEDEFAERKQLDQEFFDKQRQVLEDAAAEIQKDAYATANNAKNNKD